MRVRSFPFLLGIAASLALLPALNASAAQVKFLTQPNAAFSQANRQKKLVMLFVYTDWCGWCRKLNKTVYTDPAVANLANKNMVPLKVNPEKDSASARLASKYQVRGFPATLFIDSSGQVVHRIDGYLPAKSFLGHMKAAQSKARWPKSRSRA